tara:strand:- start:52 stop:324 length:273 start_codon:yes stop_codon:yes gene_type:complete
MNWFWTSAQDESLLSGISLVEVPFIAPAFAMGIKAVPPATAPNRFKKLRLDVVITFPPMHRVSKSLFHQDVILKNLVLFCYSDERINGLV